MKAIAVLELVLLNDTEEGTWDLTWAAVSSSSQRAIPEAHKSSPQWFGKIFS